MKFGVEHWQVVFCLFLWAGVFFCRSWRGKVLYLESMELIMRTFYLKAKVLEACPTKKKKKKRTISMENKTWILKSDRPECLNPLCNHFPICKLLSIITYLSLNSYKYTMRMIIIIPISQGYYNAYMKFNMPSTYLSVILTLIFYYPNLSLPLVYNV